MCFVSRTMALGPGQSIVGIQGENLVAAFGIPSPSPSGVIGLAQTPRSMHGAQLHTCS
jgi:hypothetical protein